MSELRPHERFIGGAVGGFCSVLATHPLDTLRVRRQAGVATSQLWRGMYQGLVPPLLGIMPIYALFFGGYDAGLRLAPRQLDGTVWHFAFAGVIAAFPPAILSIPGERIKILLQLQQATFGDVVRRIYAKEGVTRGFYRGAWITLCRDVPSCAVWFSVYESIKARLIGPALSDINTRPNPVAIMTAGACAGVAQWTVSMPLDVIKTRYQSVIADRISLSGTLRFLNRTKHFDYRFIITMLTRIRCRISAGTGRPGVKSVASQVFLSRIRASRCALCSSECSGVAGSRDCFLAVSTK
jgi:solute carrier family 25 carnitine/acylcarnitine transporter 20/29